MLYNAMLYYIVPYNNTTLCYALLGSAMLCSDIQYYLNRTTAWDATGHMASTFSSCVQPHSDPDQLMCLSFSALFTWRANWPSLITAWEFNRALTFFSHKLLFGLCVFLKNNNHSFLSGGCKGDETASLFRICPRQMPPTLLTQPSESGCAY